MTMAITRFECLQLLPSLCFEQGVQLNRNCKVVMPFLVIRFSKTFSSGRSSNLARITWTSVSSDAACDDAGLRMPLSWVYSPLWAHLDLMDGLPRRGGSIRAAASYIIRVEELETLHRLRGHCSSLAVLSPSWPLSSPSVGEGIVLVTKPTSVIPFTPLALAARVDDAHCRLIPIYAGPQNGHGSASDDPVAEKGTSGS